MVIRKGGGGEVGSGRLLGGGGNQVKSKVRSGPGGVKKTGP